MNGRSERQRLILLNVPVNPRSACEVDTFNHCYDTVWLSGPSW